MISWDTLLSLYVELSKNTTLGKRKRIKELVCELKNIVEENEKEDTLENEQM